MLKFRQKVPRLNKTNVWNILLLARDLKRNGHEEQQANYLLFSVKKDIPTEKTLGPEKKEQQSHFFAYLSQTMVVMLSVCKNLLIFLRSLKSYGARSLLIDLGNAICHIAAKARKKRERDTPFGLKKQSYITHLLINYGFVLL